MMMQWMMLAQTDVNTPQTLTFSFIPSQLITSLIVGLVAGFLATLLFRGRASIVSSVIIGLIGAFVGNLLLSVLNLPVSPGLLEGITIRYIDILVAFIGAVIVLIVYYAVLRR